MQASTDAFAAVIGSNEMVVDHTVTVQLPVFRTNLIANPNFEYGLTGWTGVGGATFVRSSAQKFSGDQSLLVTWPASSGLLQQVTTTFVAKPGTVYTVSGYVQLVGAATNVELICDGNVGTSTTASGVWQRLSCTFTATDTSVTVEFTSPAATLAGMQCYIDAVMAEGDTAVVGTYFDGDSLADLNICANPSFEQPILPEWWTPVACTAEQDNTWAVDGDYSCVLTPNVFATPAYLAAGGDYLAGVMRSGLVAGNTYTISATINVPVALTGGFAADACRIVIGWDIGAGPVITLSPQGPIGGGTQRLTVTATIPANATAAFIWLTNGYTNSAPNIVRWDAVLVRRAPTDTGFFGGQRASANSWLGTPGNSASRLNVDPYPDATVAVESINVQRQMVTDMPDGTRLISGYPSATATVVLSGNMDPTDETKTAASVFAPYDSRNPTYHGDDMDAPIVIQQGVYDGAGSEQFTTFTGGVDDVLVDSEAETVTLTCLDGRNRLRPTVTLPSIAYQSAYTGNSPGLTGGYVLDYLLRQNGIYSSPPARDKAFFYASCHGSAWPELVGSPVASQPPFAAMAQSQLTDPVTFAVAGEPADYMALMFPGVWSQQVVLNPVVQNFPYVSGIHPNIGASGGWYFDGWLNADATQDGSLGLNRAGLNALVSSPIFGSAYIGWAWNYGDAAAVVTLNVNRVAGSASKNIAGAAMSTSAWHHVSILVTFTGSTTATVTSTIDGVTTVNAITGLPAVGVEATMSLSNFEWTGLADSVQMTLEATPTPVRAFYPTAYLDASLSPLIAMVDTAGQDPWDVIQSLAEAEQGVSGLDERGIFKSRNRTNLLAAASARTVTSTKSLKTLQTDVGKSTLANHVTASVNALELSQPVEVWSAPSPIRVAAHGTYQVLVSVSDTVLTPQAPDSGYIGVPGVVGTTYWRASKSIAGNTAVSSGVHVASISISATTLRITITNSNSFPVYMVSPSTLSDVSAGTPYVFVGGQNVLAPTTGVTASSVWQPSIDARGEVALQLPDNPWRQDSAAAQQLTDDDVADLYRPRPIITDLTIVADPRLQIPDRITVLDPDGTMMADDVVLSGITTTDSATDWTQALTARAIGNPGDWVMGVPGRAELGSTTYS